MTDQELAEIESRANAATPGPWRYGTNPKDCDARTFYAELFDNSGGEKLYFAVTEDAELCTAMCGNGPSSVSNALFVSHARADIPALVAEVRRLRAESARTVLDGLGVQALVARVEELEAEAAKNRRVFVWERAWPDGDDDTYMRVIIGELCVDIGYEDGQDTAFVYLRDEYVFAQRLDGPALDAAEKLIRDLGFTRPGDTFDRSKVAK